MVDKFLNPAKTRGISSGQRQALRTHSAAYQTLKTYSPSTFGELWANVRAIVTETLLQSTPLGCCRFTSDLASHLLDQFGQIYFEEPRVIECPQSFPSVLSSNVKCNKMGIFERRSTANMLERKNDTLCELLRKLIAEFFVLEKRLECLSDTVCAKLASAMEEVIHDVRLFRRSKILASREQGSSQGRILRA